MNLPKVTGFEQQDIPVLNNILDSLDKRLSALDHTTPTVQVSADSTHTIPITIAGTKYYIMVTTVAP